jgi:hypothetical protein
MEKPCDSIYVEVKAIIEILLLQLYHQFVGYIVTIVISRGDKVIIVLDGLIVQLRKISKHRSFCHLA